MKTTICIVCSLLFLYYLFFKVNIVNKLKYKVYSVEVRAFPRIDTFFYVKSITIPCNDDIERRGLDNVYEYRDLRMKKHIMHDVYYIKMVR